MPKYRLDEYRFLRGTLTRNMQIWLEEIKIQPDGEIYYTENYVQTDLIKLLKKLKRHMTNSELHNYIVLSQTQQDIKAQFERNQLKLDVLKKRALQLLKSGACGDDALIEYDGEFYRLWIDCDEDLQVKLIKKIA
jgi:arsenate reductase-like glutaredoxin family protein